MTTTRKTARPVAFVLCAVAAAAMAGAAPFEYDALVQRTMSDSTVRAVLGPSEIPISLPMSNFLLDHPDLAAFLVNRRKIAPYRIEMLGPGISSADDGAGTRGVVNLIESTARHRVYYAEGIHQSRLFPDIRATAVIVLDLSEDLSPDSRARTITTFHVWVRMKNRFMAGLVKTLRPFLQGTVVGKFSKALSVSDSLGRLMARDPDAVAEDVRLFPGLLKEDRAAILALMALPRR